MTTNHKFWRFALGLGAALAGFAQPAAAAEAADASALRQLNDDSLRAFLTCDVARYRELLAEDFKCVLADGRVIDKAEFLRQAAQPPGAIDFRQQERMIRLYGDTALVIARIAYRHADGSAVQTRYVDVYVRRDGRWEMVSAQFTRMK